MLKNTEGLVLRNIKYGETSIISTIYTLDFGMQAYLIRGARSNKKTGIHANYFQIGQFLQLTVSHRTGKNLQYIKEVQLHPTHAIQSQNIIKQSVALYCCELVLRCVKEEEQNESLYRFLARFLASIKEWDAKNIALSPINFTLQFAQEIGFAVNENYAETNAFFDALNGEFCADESNNSYTTNAHNSLLIHQCLKKNSSVYAHEKIRIATLHVLLLFLKLQIEQMGDIKSVDVLHRMLHQS